MSNTLLHDFVSFVTAVRTAIDMIEFSEYSHVFVRSKVAAACESGFQSTIMIWEGRKNTMMQFCGSMAFFTRASGAPNFKQGLWIRRFLWVGAQFQPLLLTDPTFLCMRSGGI